MSEGPIDTPLGARLFAYRHGVHQDKVVLVTTMQHPADMRYSEVLLSPENVDDLILRLLTAKRAVRRKT